MSNELYHYGVKGMKWGVRRAEKRKAIKEYRREYKEEHKNDSRFKKAMDKIYGVDKRHARARYAAEHLSREHAEAATNKALKELGGKPAFTYKGKTYYYSKNPTSRIEMIGPDGKSMGFLRGGEVDIDLDTWNKLDDRYIEYSNYNILHPNGR